jgi:meiotic recombination protein REC8
MSRSPSAFANKFDSSTDVFSASHKNSMFPWDHAGGSSLSGAIFGEGSDRISVGTADVRMRDSSLSRSRRDSSLVPSQMGSVNGGLGLSLSMGKATQIQGEDFAFDGERYYTAFFPLLTIGSSWVPIWGF